MYNEKITLHWEHFQTATQIALASFICDLNEHAVCSLRNCKIKTSNFSKASSLYLYNTAVE